MSETVVSDAAQAPAVDPAPVAPSVAPDAGTAKETAATAKKPMLISRKADFNVAEMMRQLRDGEVDRMAQPTPKTAKVVKREKPPPPPPRPTLARGPAHGNTAHLSQLPRHQAAAPTAVAAKPTKGKTTAAAVPPPPPLAAAATDGEAGDTAAAAGVTTPPPSRRAPVKQGSVKKRAKQQQQQSVQEEKEAAGPSAAPASTDSTPANVTTVKASRDIAELRALRNRPAAVATEKSAQGHAARGDEAGTLDEISALLLRYCVGDDASAGLARTEGGARRPGNAAGLASLDSAAWPRLTDSDGAVTASAPTAGGGAIAGAGAEADEAVAPASPEVELYTRLAALCQSEHVTSSTLELVYELLKHTRVIPQHAPMQEPSATTDATAVTPQDAAAAEETAAREAASRRRLYAQQLILVMVNRMRQKKVMEEQRSQLRQMQLVRPLPGASTLSALSAPFVPAASRLTTFAPQRVSADAPPVARVEAAHAEGADDTQHFFDAIHDRLVQSTAAPVVTVTPAERRQLQNVQQSFREQWQHRGVPAPTAATAQLAPAPSLGSSTGQPHAPFVPPSQSQQQQQQQQPTQSNRTVFAYQTRGPIQTSSAATAVGRGEAASGNTALNRLAVPFTPAPAAPTDAARTTQAMNASAPAFVPVARKPVAQHQQQQQRQQQQPWASPELFAQWKKSMEDYYRSLSFDDFAAAMQQQQLNGARAWRPQP